MFRIYHLFWLNLLMIVSIRIEFVAEFNSMLRTLLPVGAEATAACAIGGICAIGAGPGAGIGGGM